MASYNGTVVLSGMISPTDTTDQYPTHEDTLGKGGYMSVANLSARDNIPQLRRKAGMLVYVVDIDTMYQLKGGILNDNWSSFSSGGEQISLKLSTMSVNGIITGIFNGTTIQNGEVAYVRGNDGLIDSTVRTGELTNVLNENKYNNFLIVNNGTSSMVYYNSLIVESHIQDIISSFPKGYDSINLATNPLSPKISNLLIQTYTGAVQFYATSGVMSKIEKGTSTFDVIKSGEDFIVSYNGSSYSAFKKQTMSISDLQQRMILR